MNINDPGATGSRSVIKMLIRFEATPPRIILLQSFGAPRDREDIAQAYIRDVCLVKYFEEQTVNKATMLFCV